MFFPKKTKVIKGLKAYYHPAWYAVENGLICIKKGENKGFVVDIEDR